MSSRVTAIACWIDLDEARSAVILEVRATFKARFLPLDRSPNSATYEMLKKE
ncbi:MAG: hypothetical protein SW833_17605 [Cyanobacteriota bacterium]|nr:hypothetical protein [Cyanobacteriota bacterium]